MADPKATEPVLFEVHLVVAVTPAGAIAYPERVAEQYLREVLPPFHQGLARARPEENTSAHLFVDYADVRPLPPGARPVYRDRARELAGKLLAVLEGRAEP